MKLLETSLNRVPAAGILLGAFISATIVLTASGDPTNCAPAPAGLVAWWPAEGNANNRIGTNNGTLRGGATFAAGEVGQAFSFDGVTGSVMVPDAPALHFTNAMTVEAWVNPKALGPQFQEIVSKWFGAGNQLSFTTSITPQGPAYLLVSSDGQTSVLGGDYMLVYTTNSIPTNHWTHFAATYDGAWLKVYLNGALENQVPWTNGIFPGTGPLFIGEDYSESLFNGLIDEVSLYSRALTPSEISAIYNAGSAGKCPTACVQAPAGLVSWWRGEGNALDAFDGNNGTLQGGVTFAPGEVGQAFSFNGVDGSVLVPDAPALRMTNALTVEAWIYPKSVGTAQGILIKWFGNGNQLAYSTAIETTGQAYLLVSQNGLGTVANVDYKVVYSTNTVPLNQWTHFAGGYDGAWLKVYLNGVLENEALWTNGIFPGTAPLYIGEATYQSPFDGLIDEPSLYNRALSGAEIQQIYNAGSAGKCASGTAPSITSQPASQTVLAGSSAAFTVTAAGTPPLSYQWGFNGTNIAGATGSALTLSNVQPAQAGNYAVRVTNTFGSVMSSNALLTVTSPPPTCVAAPSGLVAWWQAEGNALDSAGTNNGTLVSEATFASGLVGQAFSFDGNAGAVVVPDAPALRFTNAMTIEAWIYPKSAGTAQGILLKWFGNGNQLSYSTAIHTTGQAYLLVSKNGLGATADVDYKIVFSTNTVPLNQWTHFAATYDGAWLKVYLNGVLENEALWTNGIFPGTAPLYIGEATYQSPFNGLIDEPSVYNRALSGAEIQQVYNAGSAGKCGLPPTILAPPQSQDVLVGSSVTFSVTASGNAPLNFQWRYSGTNIAGATNTSLTLSNVQPSNAGSYSVIVSNAIGSATSSNAVLNVNVVFAYGNGLPLTNAQTSFSGPVTVQLLNAYSNGLVFFTLDGSTPTFASTQYAGPFIVSNNVVLRALGYSLDFIQSGQLEPTAIIIVPVYSLVPSTSGGGSIALNPAGGSYFSNTVVSVTATPASGWAFLQWLGDLAGTNPVANVTMGANKRVQAVFGTTLSTTAAGSGSVEVSPAVGMYPYGSIVALTAIPQARSYFGLWGNAASGNANPLYFTMTNPNPTVSCLFGPFAGGQAALVVTPSGHGRVTVSPRANVYTLGTVVTLTAIPDAGQSFLGWAGDASGTTSPLSITMDQSRVITANFTRKPILTANAVSGDLTDQGFRLTLDGEFGGTYRIDSSTGLVNWLPLMTVTNPYGQVQFVDPAGTNAPRMFYRAVQLP